MLCKGVFKPPLPVQTLENYHQARRVPCQFHGLMPTHHNTTAIYPMGSGRTCL